MLILAAQPAQWESSVRRSSRLDIAGLDIAGNLLGAAGIWAGMPGWGWLGEL